MKIFLAILFSIMSSFSLSFSQTSLQYRYGSSGYDFGYSVKQTFDGGYILAGTIISSNLEWNAVLIKTNSDGDTLWVKVYDGGYVDERASNVIQTSDSGFFFSHNSHVPNGSILSLIRTDKDGNIIWSKYISNAGRSKMETYDNGFILAGASISSSFGYHDMIATKIDWNGDTLWSKTYGGVENSDAFSVCMTPDSGFILAGSSNSFGSGDLDAYLIRINSFGDTLWTRAYGDTNYNVASSIEPSYDGHFIVACNSSQWNGEKKLDLLKIDINGIIVWSKTFRTTNPTSQFFVTQLNDSNIVIACNLDNDVLIVKADQSGDTISTNLTGDQFEEIIFAISGTSDGGFVLCGYKNIQDSLDSDIFLVRSDSSANAFCNSRTGSIIISNDSIFSYSTSTIVKNFTAQNLTAGIVIARPVIYLVDDCFNVDVDEMVVDFYPEIYPNPAHDFISIELKNSTGPHSIIIFDILGQKVRQENASGSFHIIDLSNLNPGIFFLCISSSERRYTEKVIIEK